MKNMKKIDFVLAVVVVLIGSFVGYSIALAGTLTSTNVQPASLVAGTTNQVTVNFTTIGVIPPGGKVKVTFGSGFNVAGASGGTCSTFLDDTGFLTTFVGQIVTITRVGGTATVAAHAETCTIEGIVNPVSAGSTGTYTITTTNPSDVLIDNNTAVTADIITNPANITIASAKITSSNTVLVTFNNPGSNLTGGIDGFRWHIDRNTGGSSPLDPDSGSITSASSPWTITLTFSGTPFSNLATSYDASHGLYVDAFGINDVAGDTNVVVGHASSILISDGQMPTVVSATTNDNNLNGKIDSLTVVYSEAVNDADRNAVAVTGYVVNALDDASFDYSSATYCQSGANPTPTISGLPGGVFSSAPAGLTINPSTGTINLATSALGSYLLSYLTNGVSPNTRTITTTITNTTPSASFSYSGSPFSQNGANPSPIFGPGASAGLFTAPAGLVFAIVNTGEIDLAGSTPGTYLITNTIPVSGDCESAVATTTVTITGSTNISVTYPLIESGSFDTNAIPALTWTGANAADLAGNIFDVTGAPVNATDGAKPILISFTSTTLDGTYGPGSNINITATYSENITSGSITVDLNNHPTTLITLSTISTNTLSGDYVVGATGSGQDITGLDVSVIAVNSAADEVPLADTDTTMPPTTITTASSINVDTTAPSAPTESPIAGTYTSVQSATLSSVGSTSIRYTTDGTDPTTCSGGTLYSGGISTSSNQTIKARSCDAVGNISPLGTFIYIINIPVVTGSSGGRLFPVVECKTGDLFGIVTGKSCSSNFISPVISSLAPVACSSPIYGSAYKLVKEKTRGVNAKGVQNAINQIKAITPPLVIDSIIGPLSEAGIKNAQKILFVTLDGIWGPKTQRAYELFIKKQCISL